MLTQIINDLIIPLDFLSA